MIRRRRFVLAGLISSIDVVIADTLAPTGGGALKVVHIATLVPGQPGCNTVPAGDAFRRGLTDLGYDPLAGVDSRCVIDYSDLPRLVAEMLGSKPALFAVWALPQTVRAVRQAAPTIPIVFVDVPDPVQLGFVESLSHPGGYSTGISNVSHDLIAKRVQLLREALPHSSRLAVLGNLANPLQADYLRATREAALTLHLEPRTYAVQETSDLPRAFAAMRQDDMETVALLPDAWFYPRRAEIIGLAQRHRIPAMYTNLGYPALGGLSTYAADLIDMSYRAAAYVDKILRGAKPADIPVQQPTAFDFVINARSAREIGLIVPPSVMLQASQVIE